MSNTRMLRESRRLAVVLAAAAVIGSGVLTAPAVASPAAPASGTARATTEPVSHRAIPHLVRYAPSQFASQAARLPSGLDSAVRDQLGETPAQFLASGATAQSAASLVSALRADGISVLAASLSPAGTTGADGESTSGAQSLVITVPTAAQAATVEAAGAEAVIGAEAQQGRISATFRTQSDPTLATGLHGGTGYYLRQLGDQPNGSDGYITICSVGFNGFNTLTNDSAFLTAGHCDYPPGTGAPSSTGPAYTTGTTARDAYTGQPNASAIGQPEIGTFDFGSDYDSGLIDVAPPIAAQADVSTWGGGKNVSSTGATIDVVGQTQPVVGMSVCRSGWRSGWQCGTVVAVDQQIRECSAENSSGGCTQAQTVNGFVSSVCSQEGDSGGSFLAGQFAVGILSGGSFAGPDPNSPPPDPVCSTSLTTKNNAAAAAWLKTGRNLSTICNGPPPSSFDCSFAYPLESPTTPYDVAHQQTDWQLQVYLAKPVVTYALVSGLRGTEALDPAKGAANPTTVNVTIDGSTHYTVPVASNGRWSLPLTLAGTGHSYAVTATTSDAAYALSTSAVASGPLLLALSRTPVPSISSTGRAGTAVGGKLVVHTGTWDPGVTRHVQWLANGAGIGGATGTTLRLGPAERGAKISVRVTGTKPNYEAVAETSRQTTAVRAGSLLRRTPTIRGRLKVGQTLTVARGAWGPGAVRFRYQWYLSGRAVRGATRATLTLSKAMRGRTLSVRVTGSEAGYTTTTVASRATPKVS